MFENLFRRNEKPTVPFLRADYIETTPWPCRDMDGRAIMLDSCVALAPKNRAYTVVALSHKGKACIRPVDDHSGQHGRWVECDRLTVISRGGHNVL